MFLAVSVVWLADNGTGKFKQWRYFHPIPTPQLCLPCWFVSLWGCARSCCQCSFSSGASSSPIGKGQGKARATAVIQPHRRPLRKSTGWVKLKVMPKNSGIKFEVQSPSCPEFRSDFLSLGSTDFPALASWTESEKKDGIANLARTIKTRLASFGWKVAEVSKSPSCPVPCLYAFYKEQHSAAINRQIAARKAHLLSTGMWP